MKRIGHLYEKMCDIALIKLAIHKAAQGKTQKYYIRKVLAKIDEYALRIQDMLVNETISLSPNRQIEIYDRSCSKTRMITVPKFFPDQILHWVLMLVIEPIIQKGMYRYSCGSVPGRGGMEAKKFVERALKDEKVRYVAKLDISKFFNSVKPKYLLPMFERKIKDKRVIGLIGKILENGGDCLPIGYYTSQWFSNFFLEGFDHFVKEELGIKYYVRYVDDMVLLDTNKRKLRKAIARMEAYLNEIGLHLKPNYQIWKVNSRPIDFVGFRFYKEKVVLRKKIFFRLCRRVRNVKKTSATNELEQYRQNALQSIADKYNEAAASRKELAGSTSKNIFEGTQADNYETLKGIISGASDETTDALFQQIMSGDINEEQKNLLSRELSKYRENSQKSLRHQESETHQAI